MTFDLSNPVVALCSAGVACEGTPADARRLYDEAWAARTNDFDASVAAHYVARLQPTPELTLHWNEVALRHADAVSEVPLDSFIPSLCLNLAESYRVAGRADDARRLAFRGRTAVAMLPADGYAEMVRGALDRLFARLDASAVSMASSGELSATPSTTHAATNHSMRSEG